MVSQVIYTRLPVELHKLAKKYVEREKGRRYGTYSYTAFLTEAVAEKLDKEGTDHAKGKGS
jgi:hypothetical protein